MENFDLIVIGSGPGGYAAAIRANQLGLSSAVVEKAELGGVCLNWGCIPTKALLKSASVFEYAKHAAAYGVECGDVKADLEKMVERSVGVAAQMSKGVEFLLSKNNVRVIKGFGKLTSDTTIEVEGESYGAKNIIIATGARARTMDSIPVDGDRIITSREALRLKQLPSSMIVVGSGAIGLEFASFYASLGCKVTVVEYAPKVAPLEDSDISSSLERSLRKAKITALTSTRVDKVVREGEKVKVYITGKKGEGILEADVVLSAVGVSANIENIGLEEVGVEVERGKIIVDKHLLCKGKTNLYAIGDVIATPALAHVATAEAIHAVEHIAGLNPEPIDYNIIPSCVYTTPEVSSVGLTQEQAQAEGYELRIGKFPFTASGKATAAGSRDGLVKLIFDTQTDKLLGAHFFGLNVTEMVGETTLAIKLGATAKDIISTIHAHPTMHEAIMESAADAHNEAIHLVK